MSEHTLFELLRVCMAVVAVVGTVSFIVVVVGLAYLIVWGER